MFDEWVQRNPDKIYIETDQGQILLQQSIENAWFYMDVYISIIVGDSSLTIKLFSPALKILRIGFSWKVDLPPGIRILNDHWERGYGDLEWRGIDLGRCLPWYFLAYDGVRTSGIGIRTQPSALCYWHITTKNIGLVCDVRSGRQGVALGQRELEVASIITKTSQEHQSPFQFAKEFCRLLCPSPNLPQEPVYGFNDWYYAYGNSTKESIMRDASLLADLAPTSEYRPYCVIDDGWQTCGSGYGGPWDRGNMFFGDMENIASEMKKLGVRPGLWFRPLRTNERLPESWLQGRNESGWLLDPSMPEVLAYITANVSRMCQEWGYKLIKHDFSTFDIFGLWGFAMGTEIISKDSIQFRDASQTTAEIIQNLYRTIQNVADNALVIGCNTMSHLAAGYVQIQRIGDDTSGKEWSRTRKMGVNSLAFRLPQHNAFYSADADCVGLTTQIPWSLNRQWLKLLAHSGTPLFISASPDAINEEQKSALKNAFKIVVEPAINVEPLDWLETVIPQKWRFGDEEIFFNWYNE